MSDSTPLMARGIIRGLVVSTALFGLLALAAAPKPLTEGQIVELPKITVSDQGLPPPLEPWLYAQAGGFEVLSSASAKTTRTLLADFLKFKQAVQSFWPTPTRPLAAATLVFCGRQRRFDQFLPAEKTGAADLIAPSVFLRNREQIAIVIDLENTRQSTNDASTSALTGTDTVEYEVDHYRQLYREYVHYLLSQNETRPPAWLEEGLAQIIMDLQLSDRTLIIGKIESTRGAATGVQLGDSSEQDPAAASNSVVGEQPFNVVLQHRKFIPFGPFFAATHESEEARNPLGNNVWAKQAYAFVHYCLFGENLRYKDALATFVARVSREPASEEIFRACFQMTYAEMEKRLRGYLYHTRHKYQKYILKDSDLIAPASLTLVDATSAQVALIKGDALRLAGKEVPAHTEYHAGYLRGDREPALLAALGHTELSTGNIAQAQKLLDAAIQAGVNRPSAYVAQARLRLNASIANRGPGGLLTPAQLATVLEPLFGARQHPPLLPETYELIAEAWSLSAVPPKVEHLVVLDEGIRAFPRDSALLARAAQLHRHAGAEASAVSIAKLGLRFAATAEDRARFEHFLTTPVASAK